MLERFREIGQKLQESRKQKEAALIFEVLSVSRGLSEDETYRLGLPVSMIVVAMNEDRLINGERDDISDQKIGELTAKLTEMGLMHRSATVGASTFILSASGIQALELYDELQSQQ